MKQAGRLGRSILGDVGKSEAPGASHSRARTGWLTALVALAALVPGLSFGLQAQAEEDQSPRAVKQRVLARMADDPSVLINISHAELPSSPDIFNLGKKSTKALVRCLQDNADAGVRAQCASLLQGLGDRSALSDLRAALADWEPQVRYAVIRALEAMPEEASFEPLHKLYQREDETYGNRMAIIDALGALSSQRAVRVLRAELKRVPKDSEPDQRGQVFNALWRSRHLMARQTLIGDVGELLALKDQDWLVLQGTSAAAELQANALVPRLVPLMEHRNVEVRNKAVYALGKIGDPAATRALLDHLPKVREARMLNNIAFALERLDPNSFFPAIKQLVAHKQAVIRLNAAFVIGDVKRPEGLSMLEQVLSDPNDFVRTSAVVAIGKLDDPKGISALEKFSKDNNPVIREEAIHALNRLSKGKHSQLLHDELFASTEAKKYNRRQMRDRAAVSLGKLGDARVREYLLGCFEVYRCGLSDIEPFVLSDKDTRTGGRLLLNWTRGRGELTELIGELKPAGSVAIAASSFDEALAHGRSSSAQQSAALLADLGDASVAPRLGSVAKHRDTWLRLSTATARLRLGDAAAAQELVKSLDNLPAEWMPRVVRLLSRVKEAPARQALLPELEQRSKGSEVVASVAASAVLLAWDPENRFFRMLDALSATSAEERDWAEYYLRRNRAQELTWVMRRALSREQRPFTRDRLRLLLEARG